VAKGKKTQMKKALLVGKGGSRGGQCSSEICGNATQVTPEGRKWGGTRNNLGPRVTIFGFSGDCSLRKKRRDLCRASEGRCDLAVMKKEKSATTIP